MGLLMGIDLGTSGLKTVVINETGSIKAMSMVSYNFDSPRYGYAEQNPEQWWNYCCQSVRETVEKCNGENISAVSFSGQMHGLVTLDAQFKPLRPVILHCDTRSQAEVKELLNTFGLQQIRELMMNAPYTGFLLPSLLWMKKHEPELFEKVRHVCLPKDYLKLRMSGSLSTDYSDASGTLAFDIQNLCWSKKILDCLGMDITIFPDCFGTSEVTGYISADASQATGLCTATAVIAGGGDQVMQGIGNGMLHNGDATVNIGSSGQVCFQVDRPVSNPELNTNTFCAYKAGRWILMGATMTAGLSLKWWNSITGARDFKEIDKDVSSIAPGSDGLIFLPYLNGERTPHVDPTLSALFIGANIGTTRLHMAKAVMEGVAFSLFQAMEICRYLGYTAQTLVASGGGAQGHSWLQMQSDIYNLPIKVAVIKEQAGLGAAIAAGVGVGIYKNLAEGCTAAVKFQEDITMPNYKNHLVYREYYECFKDAYQANKDVLARIHNLRDTLGNKNSSGIDPDH